jgi:serine/threonine protein kinase
MALDPQRLKALFLAAAELPAPAERAAFLDRECGADEELRRPLEALLRAHDDPGGFLEQPTAGALPTEGSQPSTSIEQSAGDRAPAAGAAGGVGPYRLLEKLGEGGMGAVWAAEQQEPLRRRVALKLIKPGLDSAQVMRRFEQERRALALMDHPHIAKVLDAGSTAEGRPYFVMELVHGVPITKYCDELRLSVRERLGLFIQVCQAIQHAHQKGVIHRDVKPSNVLVCVQDGKPVPKVIDFGVAKALHRPLTEGSTYTEVGAMVGTLQYMAPEQAEVGPLGVDTRADVYGLGILLYELLTGDTPLGRERLRQAAFAEVVRLIKEEEPPRPSARLSESQETLAGLAARRRTEPARLTKAVRGELDWIVMKALEKDRNRRYETASGFAADVQRYLADEPVEACPPSAGYRLRKFARRNRAALGTAMLVALALVAGMGIALWQAAEARESAETARKNESDALAAKADLENANKDLKQTRDEVEITLARSLLRPLARQPGPLTEPEVGSLWELTGSRSEELWRRFVEQALRHPMPTGQMKTRAEFALHAAVGLDPRKRLQAERLLGERMRDPALTHGQRTDLALIAVSLGGLTPEAQSQAAQTLIEALGKVTDPSALREVAQGLSTLAARMEPEEATRICSQAARILSQTFGKTTYSGFEPLAQGLAALAARMEPQEAARICSQAAAILTKTMNANWSRSVVSDAFARSLLALAPYVEPEQAAEAGATILRNMNGWGSGDRKLDALAALAARMEPKEAARVCSQAAAILTANLTDPLRRSSFASLWVQGLKALAPHLEPREAAKAALLLTEEIIKTKEVHEESAVLFASGLAALAPYLEPSETAKVAAALGEELIKTKNHVELHSLLSGLNALAPHMDAKEAARLYSPAQYYHLCTGNSQLIERFSAAVIRMNNQDAAGTLLQAMVEARHPSELQGFAEALSRVAARMEPKEAARVCSQAAAILTGSMARHPNNDPGFSPYALALVAKGISAIAPFLDREEASNLRSQTIASLSQTLATTRNRLDYTGLAEALAGLAPHMDRNEAAQAAVSVNTALARFAFGLRKSTQIQQDNTVWGFEVYTLVIFADALSAVAGRLDPKEAARLCAQAPEILIQALAKTYDARLALALARLAAHMEPKEAARICAQAGAILTRAMPTVTNLYFQQNVAVGIAAVAARMEPTEAARVCAQASAILAEAMVGSAKPEDLDVWTNCLSAVLARCEQRERSRRSSAVVTFVGLLANTSHPLGAPALLRQAREPLPCRLSPQDLVELLKRPTCVGRARRVILDQLEGHYQHPFADHWAFVRYAEEQKLDLDLTTPPKPGVHPACVEKN